jgi:hypothetical protein
MNTDLTEGNEGNEGMRRQDHRVKQKGKIVDGKFIGRIAVYRIEISGLKIFAQAAKTLRDSSAKNAMKRQNHRRIRTNKAWGSSKSQTPSPKEAPKASSSTSRVVRGKCSFSNMAFHDPLVAGRCGWAMANRDAHITPLRVGVLVKSFTNRLQRKSAGVNYPSAFFSNETEL